MSQPVSLDARLKSVSALWAERAGSTLAALGRRAVNDTSFFTSLDRGRSPSTATLEKFARFLSDGANWPAGRVPQEVVDFAHVVGISREDAALSAGKADQVSPGAGVGEAA